MTYAAFEKAKALRKAVESEMMNGYYVAHIVSFRAQAWRSGNAKFAVAKRRNY